MPGEKYAYKIFKKFYQKVETSFIAQHFHIIIDEVIHYQCKNDTKSDQHKFSFLNMFNFNLTNYKYLKMEEGGGRLTLDDCFRYFEKEKNISDVFGKGKYKCPLCNDEGLKVKSKIVSLGKILMISLKRRSHCFNNDFNNDIEIKNLLIFPNLKSSYSLKAVIYCYWENNFFIKYFCVINSKDYNIWTFFIDNNKFDRNLNINEIQFEPQILIYERDSNYMSSSQPFQQKQIQQIVQGNQIPHPYFIHMNSSPDAIKFNYNK